MTALTPYFLFEGTCRQALEFYRSYLPGELALIGVQDTPVKEQNASIPTRQGSQSPL